MAPAPGTGFFSTCGGHLPPRPVPNPPNEPVARDPLAYHWQVAHHADLLRGLYPYECNQIFKDFYDIGDYFDPYDRQLLGTDFLQDVLHWIAQANEMSCSIFIQAWAEQNEEKVIQVRNGKGLEVFSRAEIEERGRMFLTYALTMVRKSLVAWANKHQADSGQAMEAQHTEAGRGPSPLHTLAEEPSEVPASESQVAVHEELVPLAHSPPPEDGSATGGQPSKPTQALTKKSPGPETYVSPSDGPKQTQETAANTAFAMDEAKAGEPALLTAVHEIVPPTPMSTVSTPAALPNDYQMLSPRRQVKSQASMYQPPAVFTYNRGPQGSPFQSPATSFSTMNNDQRNNHRAPMGFTSPPGLHNNLDQVVMTGQGFAPMQGQPMMHGSRFPSGNQWHNGMPAQHHNPHPLPQHTLPPHSLPPNTFPPRFTGRNAPDPQPVYISNALKADMTRQGTPQMQSPYPFQQGPYVPQPGPYGMPFPQNSPFMGNAALGNITNRDNQFGLQGGHKRHVSGTRNDFYLPPIQRDDGVSAHPNPNDLDQPIKDRRSSFAGPPPRKGRRSSFRGGLAGPFHSHRTSDIVQGPNNLQAPAVATEPFPPYNPLINPNTVYVANFPEVGTRADQENILRRHFSVFIGKDVENVSVGIGKTLRRYAHVNFFHEDDVKEALKLHDTEFMGMPLQVNLKRVGGPHRRNISGNFGFRTVQGNPDASGGIVHRDSSFSKNPGTAGAGCGFVNRQRSGTDRRCSTANKKHSLVTKYSPQDARSTMVAEESGSIPAGAPQFLSGQAVSRPKKADGSTTGSSKSGRSTPTTVNQGPALTVRKKSRREEAAPAKSEGEYVKIKTIFEEAVSGSEVRELTLNPKNELVDETGKVIYKVKVPEKGKGKMVTSDKPERPTLKEQRKKASARSSRSRQSSPATTRPSSVSDSKNLKQGDGESPARRHYDDDEPQPTLDSQDEKKFSANSRVSYAKAAANLQTPEKTSQKLKPKPGPQAGNSKAAPNPRTTAKGTSGPKASSEGDESFVSAREDMSALKKKKRSYKSKSKNKSRPGTPSASSAASQAGDRPSSAASLATIARPPSANKWMELTPSDKSTADAEKPQVVHRAPTPKVILKRSDAAGSGHSLPSFDTSTSDEPIKPLHGPKSVETSKSVEALKSVEAPKSVETPKSVEASKPVEAPKPAEVRKSVDDLKSVEAAESADVPMSSNSPKVDKTSAAGDVTKAGETQTAPTALESIASDSSFGDEKFYTPPPQKETFEATVETPMQERPANVEASSSKSGPKQTPSIHPFARQKESKKKKSKKNKKEQQKGPSTTNPATTTTTESPPQAVLKHLSSDQSLNPNDNNQHVNSRRSTLDSRLRNPSPTSPRKKHSQLTPESPTVYKNQRIATGHSGPSTVEGADVANFVEDGGQSGKSSLKTSEKKGGMMELQATDGEGVMQSSVVGTEDAPADDTIIPLRTAENAAGESEKPDEVSISKDSHLSLLPKQSSPAPENLDNENSDAPDMALGLDSREKMRAKRRAKTKRQQLTRRAQKGMELQDAPPSPSGDENGEQCSDGLGTVNCRVKNRVPMSQSVHDKKPAPSGPRLKHCGSHSFNNETAPILTDATESPIDLQGHKTVYRFGLGAESDFPQPFPPRNSRRDSVASILNSRVAGNGMSSQQGVGGLVGSSEDAFKYPTPLEKKNKGRGKCHEDEMDDPLTEGTNIEPDIPSKPDNIPQSEADQQSAQYHQILECLNSREGGPRERIEEKDLAQYLDSIRKITSLFSSGYTISDFMDGPGDDGSKEGSRVHEEADSEAETEIEGDGQAEQQRSDGEEGKDVPASESKAKPAKKNRKNKSKKKGKKKW